MKAVFREVGTFAFVSLTTTVFIFFGDKLQVFLEIIG